MSSVQTEGSTSGRGLLSSPRLAAWQIPQDHHNNTQPAITSSVKVHAAQALWQPRIVTHRMCTTHVAHRDQAGISTDVVGYLARWGWGTLTYRWYSTDNA